MQMDRLLMAISTPTGSDRARSRARAPRSPRRHFTIGLARAFGGAIIFALPILFTMEMWWLGFTMDPLRLAAFIAVFIPILVTTSYFAGFEPTFSLRDDAVDALVALAVGFVASAVVLLVLARLGDGMSVDELVGKVAIQAVPASIGALLAQSLLGDRDDEATRERRASGLAGELFLAGLGALFLSFSLAPTEEIVLIAAAARPWHLIALLAISVAALHAFSHHVEFRGQRAIHPLTSSWSTLLRRSLGGYVVALAVSAAVLWSFGRFADATFAHALALTIVLGFPAAVGAAAARLIL
jgi:putative integral membrane protein (TIGR02587 family)